MLFPLESVLRQEYGTQLIPEPDLQRRIQGWALELPVSSAPKVELNHVQDMFNAGVYLRL